MDKRIIEIGRENAVVHMVLNVAESTNMDEKETLISIILDLVQFNEIFLKRNSELLDLCVNPIPFIVKGGIVPGEKPGEDDIPCMLFPDIADFKVSVNDVKKLQKVRDENKN